MMVSMLFTRFGSRTLSQSIPRMYSITLSSPWSSWIFGSHPSSSSTISAVLRPYWPA